MSQAIKLSRLALWSTFTLYVFQSFFALWSVLFVTNFAMDRSIESFDRLTLFVALIYFSYGAFGVHHLLKFAFGKRRRTELHFDGTTISVQVAGRDHARFTASDVQAYFPGRNAIQLADGRRIALPSSVPHTSDNQIDLALPWVTTWWPSLDLPTAIKDAERSTGWIRHLPKVSKALGAFGLLSCLLSLNRSDADLSIALLAFMIPFSFVFPDLLENYWRRKVVIYFPASIEEERELHPCVNHEEPFVHDRP